MTPDVPSPDPTPTRRAVALRLAGHVQPFPPVTLGLMALCVVLYGVVGLEDLQAGRADLVGLLAGPRSPESSILWGAGAARLAWRGEPWRLLSCTLLHANLLHLAMNMVALFGLGRLCESVYGGKRFLWLYLLSGLSGSILSQSVGLWLHPHSSTFTVGASGAVFGLMGAGVVFGWRFRRSLPGPVRQVFGRGLLPWIALNIFIGFQVPNIDNLGHLGGLAGGALLAFFLGTPVIPGREGSRGSRGAMGLLSAALLVGTLAAMVHNHMVTRH